MPDNSADADVDDLLNDLMTGTVEKGGPKDHFAIYLVLREGFCQLFLWCLHGYGFPISACFPW